MPRQHVAQWLVAAAVTFALHYTWEMLQAPWFEEFVGVPTLEHAVPCLWSALGDVGITAAAYLATAALFRRFGWPFVANWFWPSLVWIVLGLIATIVFERWALSVGRWHYIDEMPTIAGIGLAPILQWILVPAAVLAIVRLFLAGRIQKA